VSQTLDGQLINTALHFTGVSNTQVTFGANNFILTDLIFFLGSVSPPAAGSIAMNAQFGYQQSGGAGTLVPIQTFQFFGLAAGAGTITPNLIWQRSFPSALIIPANSTLNFNLTSFVNLSTMNMTLDLCGFIY
jgi:hypothetical protein